MPNEKNLLQSPIVSSPDTESNAIIKDRLDGFENRNEIQVDTLRANDELIIVSGSVPNADFVVVEKNLETSILLIMSADGIYRKKRFFLKKGDFLRCGECFTFYASHHCHHIYRGASVHALYLKPRKTQPEKLERKK